MNQPNGHYKTLNNYFPQKQYPLAAKKTVYTTVGLPKVIRVSHEAPLKNKINNSSYIGRKFSNPAFNNSQRFIQKPKIENNGLMNNKFKVYNRTQRKYISQIPGKQFYVFRFLMAHLNNSWF